nr:MAG TPA: hypothetical protein [Caudoviricetes sp.]
MSKLKERLRQNKDILYDIYTLAYALHDNIEQELPFRDRDIYRLGKHFNHFWSKIICEPISNEAPKERKGEVKDFADRLVGRSKYAV